MHPPIHSALVTGGNGFLGHHLVRALVDAGVDVRVFHLEGTDTDNVDDLASALFPGNICTPETLQGAFDGVDVVFHLAAMVIDWGPADVFTQVNVEGTRNVLDAAIQAGCKRFVHISSLAVHRYKHIQGGDETWPRDATTPAYATTKRDAEDVVMARADEIEVVIARPGLFPYGPGDPHNIALLLETIEKGIFGYVNGGSAQFGTSYAPNLAAGLLLAGSHPNAPGEAFVLCDDQPVSWREFGEKVAAELGRPPPRLSMPAWLVIPLAWCMELVWGLLRLRKAPPLTLYRLRVARYHLVFSNEKAKRVLGYKPTISFEEGIAETVRWYRAWKAGP